MEFTEEQLDVLRDTFLFHDKDGTGNVPNEQLGIILRSLDQDITDEELQRVITEVDKECVGSINFDQFLEMIAHLPRCEFTENEVLEAFRVLDTDQTGYISVTELRNVMTGFGGNFTEEECDEIIREADTAGDGKINYEEFVRKFMKE